MSTTTKTNKEKFVILSSYKGKSKEQLQLLGDILAKRYDCVGCKIVVDDRSTKGAISQDDVRGKILVGSMLPNYLAQAAKTCIEVNTTAFYAIPTRIVQKNMDADEQQALITYDKAYSVKTEDVSKFLVKPEETM